MKKVASCANLKFKKNDEEKSKNEFQKLNKFYIKEFNHEREKNDEENKIVNIETLDFVPICTYTIKKIYLTVFIRLKRKKVV